MVAVGLVGLQSLLSANFVAEKAIRQLKFCFVFLKKIQSQVQEFRLSSSTLLASEALSQFPGS